MDSNLKKIIWQQLGASIDTLENAIKTCPEELWKDRTKKHEFWYVAYHTLFWLDFYLSETFENFTPPTPFKLEELDPAGVLPERVYTQQELLTYLEFGRNKCKKRIESMTEESARERFKIGRMDLSLLELLLYKMRHVQHHAAQLNLLLRQETDVIPKWVFIAGE